jgi:hypothetical protein
LGWIRTHLLGVEDAVTILIEFQQGLRGIFNLRYRKLAVLVGI